MIPARRNPPASHLNEIHMNDLVAIVVIEMPRDDDAIDSLVHGRQNQLIIVDRSDARDGCLKYTLYRRMMGAASEPKAEVSSATNRPHVSVSPRASRPNNSSAPWFVISANSGTPSGIGFSRLVLTSNSSRRCSIVRRAIRPPRQSYIPIQISGTISSSMALLRAASAFSLSASFSPCSGNRLIVSRAMSLEQL